MTNTPTAGSARLAIEKPRGSKEFVQLFTQLGVRLPLATAGDDFGALVDADGKQVLVIDVDREREDWHVEALEMLILLAVNTCGGFALVAAEEQPA